MPRGRQRKSKQVPAVAPVPTGPEPRALPQPQADGQQHLAWRFGMADMEGEWGWQDLDAATVQEIIAKLRHFESMTLNEVFHRGDDPGKWYPLAQLPGPAKTRLQHLKFDDADAIHRLRVSGSQRIYGFLINGVFHLVWWDPDHTVYPAPKKHT